MAELSMVLNSRNWIIFVDYLKSSYAYLTIFGIVAISDFDPDTDSAKVSDPLGSSDPQHCIFKLIRLAPLLSARDLPLSS